MCTHVCVFPLTDLYPDQTERATRRSHWCCLHLNADCSCLCSVELGVCTSIDMYWVCSCLVGLHMLDPRIPIWVTLPSLDYQICNSLAHSWRAVSKRLFRGCSTFMTYCMKVRKLWPSFQKFFVHTISVFAEHLMTFNKVYQNLPETRVFTTKRGSLR